MTKKERDIKYSKEYRKKYPEKVKKYSKEYQVKHLNKWVEYTTKWRKKNPQKAYLIKMRHEYRKRGNDGLHTFFEWENLKAQYNWTCPCCHKSEPDVILTEDHIIPVSKGGSNNIENIQPLCRSCNSRKHTEIVKFKI